MLDIVQFNTKASIQSRNGKEDDLYMHGRVCLSMLSAQEVAQSFTSSFPYFVRIMKSFNVSGSYTLVGCFFCFSLLYLSIESSSNISFIPCPSNSLLNAVCSLYSKSRFERFFEYGVIYQ